LSRVIATLDIVGPDQPGSFDTHPDNVKSGTSDQRAFVPAPHSCQGLCIDLRDLRFLMGVGGNPKSEIRNLIGNMD